MLAPQKILLMAQLLPIKHKLVELFLNNKMPFINQFLNFAGDIANAKFTSDREFVHEMLRTGGLPKNVLGMLKISRCLAFHEREG